MPDLNDVIEEMGKTPEEGEETAETPMFKFDPKAYDTPNGGGVLEDPDGEPEERRETRGRKKSVNAKEVIGDNLIAISEKLDYIKSNTYQSDIRTATDDATRQVKAIARIIQDIL